MITYVCDNCAAKVCVASRENIDEKAPGFCNETGCENSGWRIAGGKAAKDHEKPIDSVNGD